MSTTFDRIQMRRGTAAEATAANPVLLAGEIGYETDTGKFKFGNGANAWNDLPYANQVGGVVGDASQLTGVAPLSVIPDLSSLYLPSDGSGTLAESQIPDLSNRYDAAGAAASVSADLQTFKTQTASNEDLLFLWQFGGRYGETVSGGDFMVMAAPEDLTILGASFVWDDSNAFSGIGANDTNYWALSFQLNGVQVARRTTEATGADANGGIAPEADWNFDAAVWSSRNLSKGQVMKLNIGTNGTSPPALGAEFTVAVRYQRLVTA